MVGNTISFGVRAGSDSNSVTEQTQRRSLLKLTHLALENRTRHVQ